MTDEQRAKLRDGWARRRAAGLPGSRIGRPQSPEARARISAATRERTPKGDHHPGWKGGVTVEQRRDRKSPGYKTWRREVRERAGDRCECCMCIRTVMYGHHIKGFAEHPELRLATDNGAWLCEFCHAEAHAA